MKRHCTAWIWKKESVAWNAYLGGTVRVGVHLLSQQQRMMAAYLRMKLYTVKDTTGHCCEVSCT
jgi:hypothetical protein